MLRLIPVCQPFFHEADMGLYDIHEHFVTGFIKAVPQIW
jgi:hypothetical protein